MCGNAGGDSWCVETLALQRELPEGVRACIYVVVDLFVHEKVYVRKVQEHLRRREVEKVQERLEEECQDPFQDWSRTSWRRG